MTATPRFFAGSVIGDAEALDYEVASMDDEAKYGPVFHRLTVRRGHRARTAHRLSGGGDRRRRCRTPRAGRQGPLGRIRRHRIKDARTLAAQIGLAKAMSRYDLRRAISFHSRVEGARRFSRSLPEVISWMPDDQRPTGQVWANYVSGEMTASQRRVRLQRTRRPSTPSIAGCCPTRAA